MHTIVRTRLLKRKCEAPALIEGETAAHELDDSPFVIENSPVKSICALDDNSPVKSICALDDTGEVLT